MSFAIRPEPIAPTRGAARRRVPRLRTRPGDFFQHSAAAARLLGRRAVLVVKQPRNRPALLPDGVIAVDYAPFTQLFPRAAAVVHHGGIGTTGLTMRAGRPSLVVPHAWDQPDNADRVVRLGIARQLPPRRYTAERAARELQALLDDPGYAARALGVAEAMRGEDGSVAACDALARLL